MTKSIVQCGLLLVATAGVVLAGPGTNLRWSNCFADAGVRNRSGACAANTSANLLVGSFEIPAALAAVTGIEIRMDIAVAGDSLPAWWRLNAHECRWGSLSLNSSLSGTAAKCSDWAKGAAAGGLAAYDENAFGPGTAHILAGFAVAADHPAKLTPGVEYFAFNVVIGNAKTTGAGSCGGCPVAACIVLSSIRVAVPPAPGVPDGSVLITGPAKGPGSDIATWQGGAGTNPLPGRGCPAAMRARDSSGDAIRSPRR